MGTPARPGRRRSLSFLPCALVLAFLTGCSSGPGGSTSDGAAFSVADGYLAIGETVSPFDDVPAISNLDPALRSAVQQAAQDATARDVDMRISSGWRSERLQRALLEQATTTRGNADEARRFVRSPETSSHVTGHAVDVLRTRADDWLIQHGSDYGLCQSYSNEMWHFELTVAPGGTCPAQAADAEAGG
ncbi:MAG TPA: M15 family metallopeptidase [Pseudonocardia sp.]